MSKYSELLRDPKWQKKRLQIMERDDFTCQLCFDNTSTLNVHHLGYVKKKMPWEYPDGHLITLCERCHEYETENLPAAKVSLSDALARKGMGASMMQHLANVVEGLDDGFFNTEPKTSILEFALKNHDAWSVVSEMFWSDMYRRAHGGLGNGKA